jgi:thiosulfate dehydrogenase [quinone] large subunit
VTGWYAGFLENVVFPNAAILAYLVTFGEILVGLAQITGIAALFGGLMNASFIFAGTAGANHLKFILAISLMLSGRRVPGSGPLGVAGHRGPELPGTLFHGRAEGQRSRVK